MGYSSYLIMFEFQPIIIWILMKHLEENLLAKYGIIFKLFFLIRCLINPLFEKTW